MQKPKAGRRVTVKASMGLAQVRRPSFKEVGSVMIDWIVVTSICVSFDQAEADSIGLRNLFRASPSEVRAGGRSRICIIHPGEAQCCRYQFIFHRRRGFDRCCILRHSPPRGAASRRIHRCLRRCRVRTASITTGRSEGGKLMTSNVQKACSVAADELPADARRQGSLNF
jgi:hypothetical protein